MNQQSGPEDIERPYEPNFLITSRSYHLYWRAVVDAEAEFVGAADGLPIAARLSRSNQLNRRRVQVSDVVKIDRCQGIAAVVPVQIDPYNFAEADQTTADQEAVTRLC